MPSQLREVTAKIVACGRASRWREALHLHVALRGDVVSFNAMIGACERGRQWQLALEVFNSMSKCELRADVVSFNSVLKACARARAQQLAWCLFESMDCPDVISYNAMISLSPWRQALSCLEAMVHRHLQPSLVSRNAVISSCAAGAQWQVALGLLDESSDVISFNAAMSSCGKSARWAHALALFELMSSWRLQPDVISFNSIISCIE